MMAREFGAPVTALWAREPLPRHSDLPGEYEEEAEAAEEYFNARREEKKVVAAQHGLDGRCETRRGHPAKAIIEFADEGGFDLIVVGQ
jgi:nucleotide-binding universal stress UspA family protein